MSEWRLIKTAPRDGSLVDLWHKDGFRITDTWWDDDDEMWVCMFVDADVTHWMPVPKGPK